MIRVVITSIFLIIFISGCIGNNPDYYSCQTDEDCIIVEKMGVCSCDYTSINGKLEDDWENKLVGILEENRGVKCAMCLSFVNKTSYDARCIENKCKAILK